MPPFITVKIPSSGGHETEQYVSVDLCMSRNITVAVMGVGRKIIKRRAHIEGCAVVIDEGKVHGDAPGMG